MKVRTKLLIAFVLLSCFCTTLVAYRFYSEMRPHFLEAVELTLIDTSRVLASQLAVEARRDQRLQTATLKEAAQELVNTHFPRRNGFDRPNSLRIYVTDDQGVVVFDSQNEFEGRDFSQWRDVKLTLQGQYGARATRLNPDDPRTSTHFVAAPITVKGRIVGVLSVGKTVESVNGFLQNARLRIAAIFALSILAALILSALASMWISKPLMRLENYVRSLRTQQPETYPKLSSDEIGSLGQSFEQLRRELEGKTFIEQYVHNLTHEIKSPLTGIVGAAEILQRSDVNDVDRAKLLGNIQSEARRLEDIAQKLLELASLEARAPLAEKEAFDLDLLVDEVVDSFEASAKLNEVELKTSSSGVTIVGERFLIWRALANLVQNAIDFSPPRSVVRIDVVNDSDIILTVADQGAGIPEFAKARVTERFFSMERPRTGKKSSGLGLSFVKEVMRLHGGLLKIVSSEAGTKASLRFPRT